MHEKCKEKARQKELKLQKKIHEMISWIWIGSGIWAEDRTDMHKLIWKLCELHEPAKHSMRSLREKVNKK